MKITNLFFGHDASPPDKVSSFRRVLPQVSQIIASLFDLAFLQKKKKTSFYFFFSKFQFLASIAQNLLSGNMGLALAFPTIVVPAVLGLSDAINPNESLHMTADEASWLGEYHFCIAI